jgi:ABC-2 type transport system permease protein
LLLILTPLLTMQAISGEHRRHTLDLLLAAPVTSGEIVLGKFLGLFGFLLIAIGLCSLMPLALLAGTPLDLGKLAAGLLGLMLLAASCLAAGLYFSALSSQPAAAGVATFGLLLLLWIIDAAAGPATETAALLAWLSLARHFETLLRGLVSSADIAYYLLFVVSFLALTIRHLENRRLYP